MKKIVRTGILCMTAAIAVVSCGMTAVTVQAAEYEYDGLGRVTKVTYEDNSSITYEYDANGNILKVTVTEGKPVENPPRIPQEPAKETTSAAENDNEPANDDGQHNNETEESAAQENDNEQETAGTEISGTEEKTEKTGFFYKLWNGIVKFVRWIWSVIKSFFSWLLSLIQKLLEAVLQ